MEDCAFLDEIAGIEPEKRDKSEKERLKAQVDEQTFLIETDRQFFCKRVGKHSQASLCIKHSRINSTCAECFFAQSAAKKHKQNMTKGNNGLPDTSKFEEFLPNQGAGSYAAIRNDVLCFSVAAIKKYDLERYKSVKLLYDRTSNIVGVRFIADSLKEETLTITRPRNGSMRVSFMGFRNRYGIASTGRFEILAYDEKKSTMFIDLKARISDGY